MDRFCYLCYCVGGVEVRFDGNDSFFYVIGVHTVHFVSKFIYKIWPADLCSPLVVVNKNAQVKLRWLLNQLTIWVQKKWEKGCRLRRIAFCIQWVKLLLVTWKIGSSYYVCQFVYIFLFLLIYLLIKTWFFLLLYRWLIYWYLPLFC